MKRGQIILIVGVLLAGVVAAGGLSFWKTSESSQTFSRNLEITRMLEVLESYRGANLTVSYNDYQYPPAMMIRKCHRLIQKHFKPGMMAEEWVEKNTYISQDGKPLYFVYPDGRRELVRDQLLKALEKKRPSPDRNKTKTK